MNRTYDKFGHYRGDRAKAGPPGKGFVLDENGNYDMEEKILRNLEDPEKEQDAVTKSFLKRKLDVCIQYDAAKGGFNCRRVKLFDVRGPEKENDAVTLSFLRDKTINNMGDGIFDGKKVRLRNVGDAQYSTDAVNLGYLQNNTLYLKDKAGYDAGGQKIINLAVAEKSDEAVSVSFLIKTLQFFSFLIERDLTDAVMEVRSEIFGIRKKKFTKAEVEKTLSSLEGTFKRSWRSAMQAAEMKELTETEKTQIASLLNIKREMIDLLSRK